MAPPGKFRSLASRCPAALPEMVSFWFDPASYLHPSRRQSALPDIPARCWTIARVRPRLSRMLLDRSGLTARSCNADPHWTWSIALLPPDRLEQLSRYIVAYVFGARIRTSLSRDQVLSWKKFVGEDGYRFAMTRASLLPPVKETGIEMFLDDPEKVGQGMLRATIGDADEGVQQRFLWKLPEYGDIPAFEPKKSGKVVRSVMEIVEAEWYSSLAPLLR